jgi:iron complex outermembrane recepter protein
VRRISSALNRCRAATAALGALAAPLAAWAQTSPPPGSGETAVPVAATAATGGQENVLQTVEVTGSLIRGSEGTSFNQVQVITAQDIRTSGEVTVADYLRDLPANSASSWADNFAYGATGGAGIALRGLSEKYTLVLVDGIRAAPYGFPSNGTDTFVDLNTLPLDAIERIEIVKTGEVSQYGSDAIAGVVNIITRKDFQGLEATAAYGDATEGGEATRKVGLIGGIGDLREDRYNITGTLSYFLQNGYTLADRSNTSSQDYAALPYGALTEGADYWEPAGVGAGGAAPSPCPSAGSVVNAALLLSGPGTGTACAVNTAAGLSLHPHEERISGKVRATFAVTDDTQAYVDLWDSRNITTMLQGYNGIGDSTTDYQYNPLTGGISQVPNIVPASNPYNPYGVAVPLTYTFLGQPDAVTVRSNFYRALAGANGELGATRFGEWTWAASISHSQSTVDNSETGLESVSGLANVLDSGAFDFEDPSATPDGLAGLYVADSDQAISKLDTVDLSASTTNALHLPAGDVGLGVGAQFLHESDSVTDYALQSQALAVPFYLQAIDGARNVAAAYYQVNIPVVSSLTFSQSGRYDHYSDFGSAFSPRFALRWKPVAQLTTYVSFSRGFRAPTLAETSQKNSSGVQTAADPYSPTEPNVQENYPVLVGGNPNLGPEHTKNYNAGFEWDLADRAAFAVDWYKVVVYDVIGTGNIQQIIDANNPDVVVRNTNGTIAYVNFDYENLNALSTQGFELNFHDSLPTTSAGTFSISADWTYVWNFDQTSGGATLDFAGNDGAIDTPYGASFPRWRGRTSLGWSYERFSTVLTHLFTGPYLLTQEVGRVSPFNQFNLNASFDLTRALKVYATVDNLTDRRPPYDPLWLEFPTATPYDPSLYSDEGRYAEIGVRYRFL